MGVGGYCESNRAFAIMDLAERLITLAYGPHPKLDFNCLYRFNAFNIQAFGMIDLNRSICQRRRTFFDFTDAEPPAHSTGHINDGSSDTVRPKSLSDLGNGHERMS